MHYLIIFLISCKKAYIHIEYGILPKKHTYNTNILVFYTFNVLLYIFSAFLSILLKYYINTYN